MKRGVERVEILSPLLVSLLCHGRSREGVYQTIDLLDNCFVRCVCIHIVLYNITSHHVCRLNSFPSLHLSYVYDIFTFTKHQLLETTNSWGREGGENWGWWQEEKMGMRQGLMKCVICVFSSPSGPFHLITSPPYLSFSPPSNCMDCFHTSYGRNNNV